MAESSSNLVRENVVRDAATGEVFIPASKRPDGTWRKPIKVKQGYIPQEEIRIKSYSVSKTKEKIKKTIPGAVFVDDLERETREKDKTKKKPDNSAAELTKKMGEIKISNKITPEQIEADSKQKKVRKLKKLLREIEQIEEKIKSKQPVEKEQMEKLKKKEATIEELTDLGEDLE